MNPIWRSYFSDGLKPPTRVSCAWKAMWSMVLKQKWNWNRLAPAKINHDVLCIDDVVICWDSLLHVARVMISQKVVSKEVCQSSLLDLTKRVEEVCGYVIIDSNHRFWWTMIHCGWRVSWRSVGKGTKWQQAWLSLKWKFTGWWQLKYFWKCHPYIFGEDSLFTLYCSEGLKPPTSLRSIIINHHLGIASWEPVHILRKRKTIFVLEQEIL